MAAVKINLAEGANWLLRWDEECVYSAAG